MVNKMQFKITENTSAHGFEIGEIVWASLNQVKSADFARAWGNFHQVLLEGQSGESWWVGIDEFEILK